MTGETSPVYGIQLEKGEFARIRGKKSGGEVSYLVLAIFPDEIDARRFAEIEVAPEAYTIQPFIVTPVKEGECSQ